MGTVGTRQRWLEAGGEMSVGLRLAPSCQADLSRVDKAAFTKLPLMRLRAVWTPLETYSTYGMTSPNSMVSTRTYNLPYSCGESIWLWHSEQSEA